MRYYKSLRAVLIVVFFMQSGVARSSVSREVVKTKAVSVSYRSPASAYSSAHKACQVYWREEIQNIMLERPSFSVEVVAVNSSPKSISALCVSRKYVNDNVRRVAKR